MCVRGDRWTRAITRGHGALDFGLATIAARFSSTLGGGGSCRLGLRTRRFLGAHRLDANCLDTRGLGGDRLLLRRVNGSGFGGGGTGRGMLFGGGLHIGRFAPSADRIAASGHRFEYRLRNDCRAPAARCGRGSRLFLGPNALFPLPPCTNASDLVVGEHAHVAANGYVHLPEKRDDFFRGHDEFVRQLTD